MLLTVTSNVTIDRTLSVPTLTPGEVHRALEVHAAAGGKGLNVARAALRLGCPVTVTGPLAGYNGRWLADLAREEGIPAEWFRLPRGETRNCLLINHQSGDATVVNEPGPPISPEDWRHFSRFVSLRSAGCRAVAFSGSVPPGVDPESFADTVLQLVRPGLAVYLDTSGPPLEAVLRRPQGLVVKINRAELWAASGTHEPAGDSLPETADPADGELIRRSREVLDRGAAAVVVTMGEQGALGLLPGRGWRVQAPAAEVCSTVGSGDAFLGGLIAGALQERSFPEALALAATCGAANAATPLPGRFDPQEVRRLLGKVQVVPL